MSAGPGGTRPGDAEPAEAAAPTKLDFFISYTQADRQWAEWIAWQLEDLGCTVLVQAWDFIPGSNWSVGMQEGMATAARTVAVLSENYLKSVYGRVEWQTAQAADPLGFESKLVPIKVASCKPEGALGYIVSLDLYGLGEQRARELLEEYMQVLRDGRAKPKSAPAFPEEPPPDTSEPVFPEGRTDDDSKANVPPVDPRPATPPMIHYAENTFSLGRPSGETDIDIPMIHRGGASDIGNEPPGRCRRDKASV